MTQNVPALSGQGLPSEHEMMVYHTMAEQAVTSKMYKGIGDKAGVMMIMLAARELGIPCMQALNGGLNIINGKVEISARMMNALIRKAGHMISIKESSDLSCTLIGKRVDNADTATVTFSIADAQKAGLVKQGGGWTKFPKDMCFARALSRLSRQLFADVIGIGYVEGELQASDAVVQMPEPEAVPEVEIVVENETEWLEKYLNFFDKEEKHYAIAYLNVVKDHFKWSLVDTVKELLKDDTKLFEKFNKWKDKQNG